MYRLSIFFIQLIFLLFILTFIFSSPFIISLDIGNFKYSFSSNIFAGILFTFLFFFYLFIYLYFKSKFSIRRYVLKNKYKKIEKGYFYFVEAMIAIANKDNKSASNSHKKIIKFLKDDPSLSLLLKSEVFKIEKNFEKLSEVYEDMIKSKKTQTLGYRGLMEQNLNNQDYHHAFIYGEKLFTLNPNIEKLYDTLVYIAAKTKNWNQLIFISEKAYSQKIINKEVANENKSVAFYEIAKIKSKSYPKDAIRNITKALNFKNNFPPYIDLHLQLIENTNNLPLLKKMIKKYWVASPTLIIRKIITKVITSNNLDNLDFIYYLIKSNNNYEESKKLLISFAIKNQNWNVARETIKGLIGANPTREVCLFMADIELGENNDKQISDSWILRSEGALAENLWICSITKSSQKQWNSLSDSGYFNSLVLSNSKMIDTV